MSFDIKNLEAKLCITKAVLFLLDNKVLYQIPFNKTKNSTINYIYSGELIKILDKKHLFIVQRCQVFSFEGPIGRCLVEYNSCDHTAI